MNLRFKRQLDYVAGYFLIGTNLVAARLLGLILRRNHRLDPPPQNIIFIKILGLGSVLIAADAINAVRARYPSAKLILMCGKGVRPGIEPLGLFDEFYEIKDDTFWLMLKSSFSILWKCWRLKNKWVADLEVYSRLTTIFALWTCARNRFGFHLNPVRFRININTHNVYFNQFAHVGRNYGELVKAMGCEEPQPHNFPNYPFKARTGHEKFVAINNTCSDLSKERKMPRSLFKEVCQHFISNTDFTIALTGAPSDFKELSAFVKQEFPAHENRIQVIAGTLSFQDYYDFLYRECRLMVTIDSAPLHIANRLHLPVLSLWGPTSPENLSKQGTLHVGIYLKKHCSPCVHHTEILPCKGDNICMKEIELGKIISSIHALQSNSVTQHTP